jgi:hypothetical protein
MLVTTTIHSLISACVNAPKLEGPPVLFNIVFLVDFICEYYWLHELSFLPEDSILRR